MTMALSGWRPIVTAFSIWFAHFMLCWAAVEIWPHGWRANLLAWGFTVVALAAMAAHFVQLRRADVQAEAARFNRRFAYGATAIATLAVLFTALPSMVLVP